ncbi:hypothetical protein Pan44_21030 [Caulifigura coniformis]|uniref:Carboxypeptidase regulatory-like domain-containing protein n=1 Tax=Caulifigura coniformis TaxID=2527983 RepID=A0A517SD81_9PLAN|nr:carboxypeptidase-like regulatory domain-containing protein [Caulifigura coniformis]QDT54076.1 hypothetical protein Pan44_21030 [Caulifigura coniformis]
MTTESRFPTGPLLVTLAILVALGCSARDRWQEGRPPVVPASGVVLHDGAPLAGANVVFLPKGGTHTAFGTTDPDGRFQLTTFDSGDGAVAGEYDVTVTHLVIENDADPRDPEHLPPLHHAEYSLIPEHYYDRAKSGLTASVPAEGTETLEITLSGKPTGKFDKGKPKYRTM